MPKNNLKSVKIVFSDFYHLNKINCVKKTDPVILLILKNTIRLIWINILIYVYITNILLKSVCKWSIFVFQSLLLPTLFLS